MKIDMSHLDGKKLTTLAGAPNGRRAMGALLAKTTQEPLGAELLHLDFAFVQVATASFLRECVFRLRDAVRSQHSNFYPVVTNANDQVFEELALLAHASNDVLMTCSLGENDEPIRARLIGELDPKQKLTFDLVNSFGETNASELMQNQDPTENAKQNAWNNRLAGLANLGLVFEISQGRAKRYKRLFEEAIYGD
jgi:hypothetical protein